MNNGVILAELIMRYLVIGLIVTLVIVLAFFMVKRLDVNSLGKYSIIGVAAIFVVFFLLQSFGYSYFILFNLLEWTTKFVLPWIALYWLIRAVKLLEKRG